MGPLIDQELEQTDSRHNELMNLNQKLTDAFQLYTRLMKEAANVPLYTTAGATGYMPQQAQLPSTLATSYLPPQQTVPADAMYTYGGPQDPSALQQVCS